MLKQPQFDPRPREDLLDAISAPWPLQNHPQTDGSISQTLLSEGGMWGNPTLPIAPYAEHTTSTILSSPVTVLRSPTGSGKSTGVPQMMLHAAQAGADIGKIWVAQPRIVAARMVASRIADELAAKGLDGGSLVGYQTANEGNSTPANRIVVVTDGLIRQILLGDGVGRNDVIVADEVHERGRNQDMVLALALGRLRTVVMSATVDLERTTEYIEGVTKQEVPVLDLPGTPFAVEKRAGGLLSDEIVRYARLGHGIIQAIVPGKREIAATASRIMRRLPNGMAIVAVHGDQTPEEQAAILKEYPNGVVVIGTNVLQTSLTIAGSTAMIDSGWTRTGVSRNGIRSNPIVPASANDRIQRAGRVGRTAPGIYVLADMDSYPPHARKGKDIVAAETDPEMLRADPTDLVLRLAGAGVNLASLPLMDRRFIKLKRNSLPVE